MVYASIPVLALPGPSLSVSSHQQEVIHNCPLTITNSKQTGRNSWLCFLHFRGGFNMVYITSNKVHLSKSMPSRFKVHHCYICPYFTKHGPYKGLHLLITVHPLPNKYHPLPHITHVDHPSPNTVHPALN